MKIQKHSGEWVNFDKNKLIRSLQSAGANLAMANSIVDEIENSILEGFTTKQIFRLAFQKLKSKSRPHAARYNLKQGIQLLGPAGFHFEKYIARIFELQGYRVKTNEYLNGKCVTHELDVLIKKDNQLSMIECKFHGSQEIKTDVKVPMYILSRFNDLKVNNYNVFTENEKITKCWIVTNYKFTLDAIKFGECSKLSLLSWDYPEQNGLKEIISNYRVYPITCLTTITKIEKESLLNENILTVYDFIHQKKMKIKFSKTRMNRILNECHQLLNSST